jgi:hypothetical protein
MRRLTLLVVVVMVVLGVSALAAGSSPTPIEQAEHLVARASSLQAEAAALKAEAAALLSALKLKEAGGGERLTWAPVSSSQVPLTDAQAAAPPRAALGERGGQRLCPLRCRA